MASSTKALQSAKNLYLLLKSGNICPSSCREVLKEMEENLDAAPAFKIDTFLKTLAAAEKTLRVEKRGSDNASEWDELLKTCDSLSQRFKKRQEEGDSGDTSPDEASIADDGEGVPSSSSLYLARLKRQRKELYKNPPVLPPSSVVIQEVKAPPPKRDAHGFLTFEPGTGKYDKSAVQGFSPNLTPEEILRGGAFGGTYFRSIVSAVTNKKYTSKDVLKQTVPDEWIEGLDKKTMLTSQTYLTHVNKFKAKCGGCKSFVPKKIDFCFLSFFTHCDLFPVQRWVCGKALAGFLTLIPMVGFSGIVDFTKGVVRQTTPDRLHGGKAWLA